MKDIRADIQAVQHLISRGMLTLVHEPCRWEYGNYYFSVPGMHITFKFFADCGDWDYLDSVYVNGDLVASYDDMNKEEDRYDTESWWQVGRWMPVLPSTYDLGSLDDAEEG